MYHVCYQYGLGKSISQLHMPIILYYLQRLVYRYLQLEMAQNIEMMPKNWVSFTTEMLLIRLGTSFACLGHTFNLIVANLSLAEVVIIALLSHTF